MIDEKPLTFIVHIEHVQTLMLFV